MNLSPFHLGAFPTPPHKNTAPTVQSLLALTDPIELPRRVNFRHLCKPAIDNQGPAGACVGFAVAALKEAQVVALYGRPTPLSALWVYNQSKLRDRLPDVEGTWVSVAAQVVRDLSVATEADFPYHWTKAGRGVPADVRITPQYHIDRTTVGYGLKALREALAAFGPVVLVIAVNGSFFAAPGGKITVPPYGSDPIYGYHAVLATGYDDETGEIEFKNSWGDRWGDRGWGYLSYAYIERHASDITAATDNYSKKIIGDLNGDSKINILDAHVALMMSIGSKTMTPQLARIADVSGDKKVNVADATALLRRIVTGG